MFFCFHEGLSPVGPESQIRYSVTSTPTITSNYMSMDVRVSTSQSVWCWLASLVSWKWPKRIEGKGKKVAGTLGGSAGHIFMARLVPGGPGSVKQAYRSCCPACVPLPLSRPFSSCLASPSSCLCMVLTPLCCHGLWVMKVPWQQWGSPSTCSTVPS